MRRTRSGSRSGNAGTTLCQYSQLLLCAAGLGAAALAGCASRPPAASRTQEEVDASLDSFAATDRGASLEQVFASNAAALESLKQAPSGGGAGLAANPGQPTLEAPAPAETAATAPAQPAVAHSETGMGPPADLDHLAADPQQALAIAPTGSLLATLRKRLLAEEQDPLRRGFLEAALAGIDAAAPSAASAADETLTPVEREAVALWRDALAQLRERLDSEGLDALTLLEQARNLGEKAEEALPLTIRRAALARRVEGFGAFEPLPTPLLAGRAHPMGLYIEIEGFSRKPDGQGRYVVELGEEVTVRHEADDLLAWRRPEQIVRDVSLNKRRDFYLVDRLDLPATLTVGRYILKARVRDVATGQIAEATIPFEVVADPKLAGNRP